MESLNTLAFYAVATPHTAIGVSVLQAACLNGDYETFRSILTFSPSTVDSLIVLSILEKNLPPDYKGMTPKQILMPRCSSLIDKLEASSAIHFAARVGTASQVRRLVRNGANVNDRTRAAPPLHFAAESNSLDVVMEIVSQGAYLSTRNNIGLTAAQVSAWRGKTENLLYLMNRTDLKPFTIGDVDNTFMSYRQVYLNYLHLAIWGEHQDTVTALIECGYDVNESCGCWPWLPCVLPKGSLNYTTVRREDPGQYHSSMTTTTPLMLSALTGNLDIFYVLIKNGAKLRYESTNPNQKTLLSFAVQGGSVNILQYVLANSNQIVETTIQNHIVTDTLLHLVRGEAIAKVLIDYGLDLNARSYGQFTPLRNAAQQGDIHLAKLLVSHGATVTVNDLAEADRFVLGDRKSIDVFKTTKYFIDQGLDVNAADRFGRTPLHYAAHRRATGKIRLLLDAGADANAVDSQGRTALHCTFELDPDCGAIDPDDPDIVLLLLERGANHLATFNRGDTALHEAATRQLPLTMEVLLQHHNVSADCSKLFKPMDESTDKEYFSPSATSSTPRRVATSPLVLAVNQDGQTALHKACKERLSERKPRANDRWKFKPQTVQLLLQYGVDNKLKDKQGKKAADYANAYGNVEALNLIQAWEVKQAQSRPQWLVCQFRKLKNVFGGNS